MEFIPFGDGIMYKMRSNKCVKVKENEDIIQDIP